MFKTFQIAALALAMALPNGAAASWGEGQFTTDVAASDSALLSVAPRDPFPTVDIEALAEAHRVAGAATHHQFDPFNPYPDAPAPHRERFGVYVLEELAQCSTAWTWVDCPQLVMADGSVHPTMLSNYTHTGARALVVERITYDFSRYPIADAPSIVYVAVGG